MNRWPANGLPKMVAFARSGLFMENVIMNSVNQALKGLKIAEPLTHEGLCMYPLLREQSFDKDYITLDEALAKKTASITELSEGGSVPELFFRNHGDQAVFLLDGEEVVGAKQNRILNISILAPAHKDTVIPVSCVEAGRWQHTSSEFESASRAQFSASRAKKAAFVSEDIASSGARRSNQSEVWDDISVKMSCLGSSSDTGAVEAAFVDHESALGEFVDKLKPVEQQFGAVFSIKGNIVGMELFDSQETCQALLPKVIRSYALDAIDRSYHGPQGSSLATPDLFLKQVAMAEHSKAKAIGEGADLRFDNTAGIAGGALMARDRLIHLCAFVWAQQAQRGSDLVHRRHYR